MSKTVDIRNRLEPYELLPDDALIWFNLQFRMGTRGYIWTRSLRQDTRDGELMLTVQRFRILGMTLEIQTPDCLIGATWHDVGGRLPSL